MTLHFNNFKDLFSKTTRKTCNSGNLSITQDGRYMDVWRFKKDIGKENY